jgi:Zn-finger nucleic acid-binding protein
MIYRDGSAVCPRCSGPLDNSADGLGCARCHGVLMEIAAFKERLQPAAHGRAQVPALTVRHDRARHLACPVCRTPMAKVMLEAIDLDRCDEHGVWLDRGELARVVSTVELLVDQERVAALRAQADGLMAEAEATRALDPSRAYALRLRALSILNGLGKS